MKPIHAPPGRAATVSGTVTGIECVTNAGHAVIASSDVDQIVEYAVASVPLAREWIAGLAVQGEDLVVSVRLDGNASHEPRRSTKAVLLAARSPGAVRWAIEVNEVLSFVQVRATPDAARGGKGPLAPWLVPATRADGGDVSLLDVSRMLADLQSGESRP